ncbi:heat shock protein 30C-like [Hemicordylus capensis]|uniref:heat shock protein 30C-like n=1 Tax=Hemicordylus capensis TaxID=884348 RepID=UPI002302A096|nr:heat shock protein 30C-like [Hemicordylus capensis]
MAGYSRDERPHLHHRTSRKSTWLYREPAVEYVPVGLPPKSLLDKLVCDMQVHLEEMERMRAVLVDAYPCLASSWVGSGGGARNRSSRYGGGSLAAEDEDDAGGSSSSSSSNYRFAVSVAGFSPEELSVKLDGRKVTVSGKHTKKTEEEGCVSHEYREVRKEVRLPDDANLDAVACTLAPEGGCLRIEAPRLTSPPAEERAIPITIRQGPDPPAAAAPPLAPAIAAGSLPEAKEAPPPQPPPANPEATPPPAAQ